MANTGLALSQAEMDQISSLFTSNTIDSIQGGNLDESRLVKAVRAEKAEQELARREQEIDERNSRWDDYYRDDEDEDNDDFYNESVDFDDIADEDDPNQNVKDLERSEHTSDDDDDYNYDNPQDFFYYLPDDVELAPGITKKSILDFKKNQEEFTETANFNKHLFDNMTTINGFSKGLIEKNMISQQKLLSQVEQKLAHPQTRADQKVHLYEDKARLEAEIRVIEQDWNAEQHNIAQRKAAQYDHGFSVVDMDMKKKVGNNWNGNEVWNYAVRSGIPVEALREVMITTGAKGLAGSALADILMKAMAADNFTANRQAKLNKTMGAKNTAKSVTGSIKAAPHSDTEVDAKKNYLMRKARKTGLSKSEHIEMYKYLKD